MGHSNGLLEPIEVVTVDLRCAGGRRARDRPAQGHATVRIGAGAYGDTNRSDSTTCVSSARSAWGVSGE